MIPAVLLALLPWILLGLFMALGIREPRPLPSAPSLTTPGGADRVIGGGRPPPPLVSVVVPARNEARNILRCLETLADLRYSHFEVVVVDDRSDDGTGELARRVPPGNAEAIRVVDGAPLPGGWFGKPWACRQGAEAARGDLLLFTDADTTHRPDLLARAVAALEEDGARALSLLGEQEMGTFGEKLVQPQIFALIGLRFRRLDRVVTGERWRDAIANGQYILVEREAYNSIDGHEAVKGEVVEDLRLAQELVRAGHPLTVRLARDAFATRMYTSLEEVVDGWTKNVAVGARQASGRLAPLVLPAILLLLALVWLLPPTAFVVSGVGIAVMGTTEWGWTSLPFLTWAGLATLCTVAIQAGIYHRLGAPAALGLIHPLGGLVVAFILARSWIRGEGRIEWKGRRYEGGVSVTEESGGPTR